MLHRPPTNERTAFARSRSNGWLLCAAAGRLTLADVPPAPAAHVTSLAWDRTQSRGDPRLCAADATEHHRGVKVRMLVSG
jgi:hypothetical protein